MSIELDGVSSDVPAAGGAKQNIRSPGWMDDEQMVHVAS
jgi:hypothetical protein